MGVITKSCKHFTANLHAPPPPFTFSYHCPIFLPYIVAIRPDLKESLMVKQTDKMHY